MKYPDLEAWLQHIRSLHPFVIDYSLTRILAVADDTLDLLTTAAPVIRITGTNGKGSTVAAMEAILLASHHRVGSFTSPYLLSFNEQIRINGHNVSDAVLMTAFDAIEAGRGSISLSEFEFTTLAALFIFKNTPLDMILFEVGLGGGQDATHIIDADVCIVTSLALDHEEYLGTSLEAIAESEAQLLTPHKIGVIGIPAPPQSLTHHAHKIGCRLQNIERDFHFALQANTWSFWNDTVRFAELPRPIILCKNAALAIQALWAAQVNFSHAQLVQGLQNIQLQGRLQFISAAPSLLIDVAHNVEAVENLRNYLSAHRPQGKVLAVFSMLKDKNIAEVISLMAPLIDQWFIAPIAHPRGASLVQLQHAFQQANVEAHSIEAYDALISAAAAARQSAQAQDLLLFFGSFFVARLGLSLLL